MKQAGTGTNGGRKPGNGGTRRRRANHRAAAELPEPPLKVPEHPSIPAGDAELIEDDAALADLAEHVRSTGRFAYDTEFIGEASYWPKLCLVQIATAERVAVIDAMADLDLEPVWRLVADPAVRTLVHAGAQDLEPIARHLGRAPGGVFDTQIGAGFIALPYPLSLARLVEALLGFKLAKGLTFTSWDERPLSTAHLRYAADDVRYLPAVYEAMAERLDAWGHRDRAEQEFAELCERSTDSFDALTQAQRLRGWRSLTGRQRAVLCELVTLRDAGAREQDIPPRSYLKDEVLMELTRKPAKSADQLSQVRGLPRPVREASGDEIVRAIQRGLDTPQDQRPPAERKADPGADETFRAEGFWAVLQSYCHARGLHPALVATRAQVLAQYHALVNPQAAPPDRLASGWRAELLNELMAQLNAPSNGLHFTFKDNRVELDAEGRGE